MTQEQPTVRHAPSLPDTLRALAHLLPERVLMAEASHAIVRVYGQPTPLLYSEARDIDVLERALREECAARGWLWVMEHCDYSHMPPYRVALSGPDCRWRHVRYADTPAHALALALVGAGGG